jgi:hypothetical protein
MLILNSFVFVALSPFPRIPPATDVLHSANSNDIFERIAGEASKLASYNKKSTISSREIQTCAFLPSTRPPLIVEADPLRYPSTAVRLILPGELSKHAISEGTKAVTSSSCSSVAPLLSYSSGFFSPAQSSPARSRSVTVAREGTERAGAAGRDSIRISQTDLLITFTLCARRATAYIPPWSVVVGDRACLFGSTSCSSRCVPACGHSLSSVLPHSSICSSESGTRERPLRRRGPLTVTCEAAKCEGRQPKHGVADAAAAIRESWAALEHAQFESAYQGACGRTGAGAGDEHVERTVGASESTSRGLLGRQSERTSRRTRLAFRLQPLREQ